MDPISLSPDYYLPMGDAEKRQRLIEAYSDWVTTRSPHSEWSYTAIHDAIWKYAEPEVMLGVVAEVIDLIPEELRALNYVGAGPLEDLLGGKDEVMVRALNEAARSRKFRLALASTYGVRFCADGYEDLHAVVEHEIHEIESWIASSKATPS